MAVLYATVDDLKAAADVADSARADAQIARLLDAASRRVEVQCGHRRFYPETATRYLAWPDATQGTAYRLWLGTSTELVSLTSLTSGGVALTDYFLEPQSAGPPYTRLEIDQASGGAFSVASGIGQRSIALTGVFGACADLTAAGTLAEALDASETGVDIAGAVLSVGHTLKVDDEYMTVTGRSLATSGVTLAGNVTASKGDTGIPVSSAASFTAGEAITVDAERMLIVDIAGSTLIVHRGWSGSALAAHTSGATIYAPRTLTVARGQLGTTAATHTTSTAIAVHTPPPLVRELTIAETLNALQQESSAYARTVGSGEAIRPASGRGLADLRTQVRLAHGRKGRTGAV